MLKNILITGANSYIGTSLEKWLNQYPDKYKINTVDMINNNWREKSFEGYDVVFHVAGLAHVSTDPKMKEIYYKVNRDLTIETALKAKNDGVKQFIFMSSIIVYGDSSFINKERVINIDTIPIPSNFYGDSKLQAEKGILQLQDYNFNIVIIRPPMIYGKGSKGNYKLLSKIAKKSPIFPNISNKRSMLHIDNLCEFIRIMIKNEECGIFFPQNDEYVNTSELVKLIAKYSGKRIRETKIFNPLLKIMGNYITSINKAFGSLVYDKEMSKYKENYIVNDIDESIYKAERL